MSLFETKNDSVLQEDLENIVNYPLEWDNFKGKTFFITGATGLVGASVIRALCCANRVRFLNIRILALARS
ncbi:MAG: NAD(P)-dependent oxidoreductase, partial [Clostridia bacterium]|nr:NAD(P)-dependent oxidoreductase [Clostridia bacterium]